MWVRNEAPCHHCPDRHPGCHRECEKYISYNEKQIALRKVKADTAELGWALYEASKRRPVAMRHQGGKRKEQTKRR